MIKKIIVMAALSLMSTVSYASDKKTTDVTTSFEIPDDMKNCKIYRMKSDGFSAVYLYVTRCPNAKTETTTMDKTPTTVLTDDEE